MLRKCKYLYNCTCTLSDFWLRSDRIVQRLCWQNSTLSYRMAFPVIPHLNAGFASDILLQLTANILQNCIVRFHCILWNNFSRLTRILFLHTCIVNIHVSHEHLRNSILSTRSCTQRRFYFQSQRFERSCIFNFSYHIPLSPIPTTVHVLNITPDNMPTHFLCQTSLPHNPSLYYVYFLYLKKPANMPAWYTDPICERK